MSFLALLMHETQIKQILTSCSYQVKTALAVYQLDHL